MDKEKIKKSKKVKKIKKAIIKNPKKIKTEVEEKRIISFSLIEMIIVIVIVGIAVSVCTGYLVYKNYNSIFNQTIDKENKTELKEFVKVYEELKEKYIEDIDKEALINAAIDGMLNYLDVYTDYLDEDTTLDLQDRLNGEYKGIGVEITNNEDGNVEIVTIFPNTPAEKAGLKVGDVISQVNGKSMLGKTSSEVASTIKGASISEIKITYKRNEAEKTINIDIENVIIPSVEHKVIENNIGYIKLSTFSSTSYSQMKKSLEELKVKNIESLIIDVRNNSGGYLSSAKSIIDLFLEKGKVIYQLKYKDGISKKYTAKNNDKTTYPIVVLINEGSASASEILAAALQESYVAKLVGAKSFGKGTVQETEILTNGSMIKYTSAYWLTPNGNSINEKGIEPDIIVKNTEGKDEQLECAVKSIKK